VSGSVWFRPEQISAVTDPSLVHFRPDRTNTTIYDWARVNYVADGLLLYTELRRTRLCVLHYMVEIVLERVLVLFRAGTMSLWSGLETFLFRRRTM